MIIIIADVMLLSLFAVSMLVVQMYICLYVGMYHSLFVVHMIYTVLFLLLLLV